jgi:phosphoglycolate phosphatase
VTTPRLICDLDGTLADSAPSLRAAGNRLLAELGRPPVTVETYKTFVGRGQRVQVQRLLEHTGGVPGDHVAPHLARFRTLYVPLEATAPMPGAPEALATLRAEGWRLAVCTQKPEGKARTLLAGLAIPVDAVAGGDTLTEPDGREILKPDPRLFHAAADPLGDGPALYVGDSETDAEAAAAAGVPFLLYLKGYRKGPIAAAAAFDDWRAFPALARETLAAAGR